MIYADLRRLARRRGHAGSIPTTLGTTGLVHECYLRLAGSPREQIADRGHFFNLASRIMRQILCDYARRNLRVRHGSGQDHEDVDEVDAMERGEVENLVALDDLLTRLESENPSWAKVDGPGALAAFTESLELRREAFGNEHNDTANSLWNLGNAEVQLGGAQAEFLRAHDTTDGDGNKLKELNENLAAHLAKGGAIDLH